MSNLLNNKSEKHFSDFSAEEIALINGEINNFVLSLQSLDLSAARAKINNQRFGIALNSILHLAVKFSNLEAVVEILRIIDGDKMILNIRNQGLFSPLHIAAIRGNIEIFDLLIEAGCDFNPQTSIAKRQWRPIHYAAQYGHLQIVEKLIALGVDKEVKTYFYLTPLLVAAEFGQLEVLQYLIKIKADLNTKTSDENSNMNALHYATIQGSASCVVELLKAGINKNEHSASGLDALDFAARINNCEILKILISWGVGDLDHAAFVAKDNNNLEALKLINEAVFYKKNLFNKIKLHAVEVSIIENLRGFNEENLHEAKIILGDKIAFNAYGLLALSANVGFFSKIKKSFKGFCLENGFFKIAEELARVEKIANPNYHN